MDEWGKNLGIPIAIVIAGALIAGAVLYSSFAARQKETVSKTGNGGNGAPEIIPPSPVGAKDHLLGSPNAELKIVEYSDFECPFCKGFHKTMQRIIGEYGPSGKVSWVYRHFPIESIHPKAKTEAVASECVSEIGGNDAFWRFADRFFELSLSNNNTDLEVLDQIVSEIGIDGKKYGECLKSGRYDALIKSQFDEAVKTGGQGTPWSLIISSDGEIYPINGAQPYALLKETIDTLLLKK